MGRAVLPIIEQVVVHDPLIGGLYECIVLPVQGATVTEDGVLTVNLAGNDMPAGFIEGFSGTVDNIRFVLLPLEGESKMEIVAVGRQHGDFDEPVLDLKSVHFLGLDIRG